MKIRAGYQMLAFVASLHHIGTSGTPPVTRDFLANFGKSNENANHQDVSTQFRCLSNDETVLGVHHCESSSESDRWFPTGSSFPKFRAPHPTRSSSPIEPPPSAESLYTGKSPPPAELSPPAKRFLRVRSRSPPSVITETPPTHIDIAPGRPYPLTKPEVFILTSYRNPQRRFELRRYTFPVYKPIRKFLCRNVYVEMPTQEQIVLSTASGDVFAMLETSDTMTGMYSNNGRNNGRSRVKINMQSGEITSLTKDEIREVPVGRNCKIPLNFRVEFINDDNSEP